MKSIQTESSITVEGDSERRQDQLFRKVVELWPLIVVVIGGIVTAITFYNKVANVLEDQKNFKATIDARRDKTRDDMESIRVRLAVLETQIK